MGFFVMAHTSTGASRNRIRRYLPDDEALNALIGARSGF
uniref:Uncharacterized protein n=1 Tax=Arundo donax TaxID=35708 RepID=A0A0A8XTP1_ARUDO